MRLQSILLAGAIAASLLTPAVARADDPGIELQTGSAIGLGSGCNLAAGDARILVMGNDVAIVYTRLALRLPAGPSDGSLVDIKNCAVRVPATLHAGSYLSQIVHTLDYGVNKSAGSSGEIAAVSGFGFMGPVGLSVDIPAGASTASHRTATRTTTLSTAGACGGADVNGLFRADVAISGSRKSTSETLAIGAVGHDLRYDMTFTTSPC